MNEMLPSQAGQGPPAQPAPIRLAPRPPRPRNRTGEAIGGGMVAGMGLAVALAVVMHVIQQASGSGYSIGGSVLLVLFLGLIIGSALGVGLAAAVPDDTAASAAPHPVTPADQPPAQSA